MIGLLLQDIYMHVSTKQMLFLKLFIFLLISTTKILFNLNTALYFMFSFLCYYTLFIIFLQLRTEYLFASCCRNCY